MFGRPAPIPLVRRLIAALAGLVVAVVGIVLLAVVVVPRLVGWVPLTVLSGSMEPSIPTGSQVIVRPVGDTAGIEHLAVGDVITFLPRPDDSTPVTHRIVGVGFAGDGSRTFTTRGDANASADPDPVGARQVRGEVVYHVPFVGHVAGAVGPELKRGVTVAGGVGLAAYAVDVLVLAWRSRRARPHRVVHSVDIDSQLTRREASVDA